MKKSPLVRKTPLRAKSSLGTGKARKKVSTRRKEKCPSISTLDKLFSDYIRRNGECQLWKFGGIQCSSKMDCSHIKSRRFHSVRWDIGNAICACAGHHMWQHDHPDQSTLALIEILGIEHLDALQQRFLEGRKPTPDQKREIARWLREQLKEAA